ncbi:hypothetical protein HRbin02_01137 [Candidatus Calditenuaceae archaeon HR02]|nr:hypothetical protein HRbin02_01137 [Candidatus Calditenuaceae archaeon HR02]
MLHTIFLLISLTTFLLVQSAPDMAYPEKHQISDLQSLIDSAEPYSTIPAPPGIYAGPIRIWKPLALKGAGDVVVDGKGSGDVVVIKADDVIFEGFRIINSFPDVAFEPAGIKIVNSRNVTITGNRIENVIHAIYVVNSTDVKVTKNHLTSFPERSVNDRGHGVYLWYSVGVGVSENRIENVKDGVYSDHSYNVTVMANEIFGSRYGIHLMYSARHVIDRNVIRGNLVGMALMYSFRLMVTNNTVRENRGLAVSEGIFIRESSDVYLERNLVVGNAVGLHVVNSPYPREGGLRFRMNVIAFNNVGVRFDGWASAVFERNDLVENAQQISLLTPSATSLWMRNFWSDRGLQIGEKYLAKSTVEDLLDRWPVLWAFAYGPGFSAIKTSRSLSGLGSSVKAIDEFPAKSPNALRPTVNAGSSVWLAAALALTLPPVAAAIAASRR